MYRSTARWLASNRRVLFSPSDKLGGLDTGARKGVPGVLTASMSSNVAAEASSSAVPP
jgi:hypothetical protein